MMSWYEHAISFIKRYERPLATLIFVIGFLADLLSFGLLALSSVTQLFAAYLVVVIALTLVAHYTHEKQGRMVAGISVLAPLLAQFTFGSLLSGFLIFYTKSAVLSISWPFLILIGLIFLGNELFRNYRDRLIFQTILVYFSLYAFSLVAFPLQVSKIGTRVFLESTGLAILSFAFYIAALAAIRYERLKQAFLVIILSASTVTVVIVASYLAGLLPPIPLVLKEGGVYHSVKRDGNVFALQGETAHQWWDPRTPVVHHTDGTPLYAYSAIYAPGAFETGIVHEWQRYDEALKSWKTESTIAFVLTGGRAEGYRGYSIKDNPKPGSWRVLVKTSDGQTIGKFTVQIEKADVEPALTTKQR